MSSYQHQGILGNFLRDSLPDYLTCGYCAREFLLDNITLFIAHKIGGCDKSCHFGTTSLPHLEDTSSPLTCSSCSRVFMTARGLLHHFQEDHKMVLCLQKSPLMMSSNNAVRPPPAHSAFAGAEPTSTNCCSRMSSSSSSSCDQDDQPTDLSMTCSSSLGKERVKCDDDKCEVIIEPISSLNSTHVTRPGSAVPNKKLLFEQHSNHHRSSECEPTSGVINGSSNFNDEDEDKESRCSNVFRLEQTSDTSLIDTNVSISVKEEYQQDTLYNVSLRSEKDREKHSKLKRLLQQDLMTSELDVQSGESRTKHVVYRVPFLASQDLQSPTLNVSTSEPEVKTNSTGGREFLYLETTSETTAKSPATYTGRILPKSTLEQSNEGMVRSSVASEIYPEEFEILSLYPNSSPFSTKHVVRDSNPNLPFIPTSRSPHLLMPDEKYLSHNLFNLSHSDLRENNNIISMNSHWKTSPGEDQHLASATPPMTSPVLSTNTSIEASFVRKQLEFLRNSLNQAKTLESNNATQDSVATYVSEEVISSRDKSDVFSTHNPHKKGQFSDEKHFMSIAKPHNKSPTSEAHHKTQVAVPGDQTYHSLHNHMWLNDQNGDTVTLPGAVLVPTGSSSSNHLDAADQDSLDTVSMDTDDVSSVDGKSTKKRRYPTSRPFKCGSCDQAFNQRIHLKKHMSKHTGVKPFKCQQCDYSTVERSHLKVHYRIHTGEKPYRCMFCDYATAQNSTLKIHLKRHHEGQATSKLTRLRDNSQVSCSLDDDDWNLSDSFFINTHPNSQTHGSELTRCASSLGGTGLHSLATEDQPRIVGGKRVDTSRSCSRTSCYMGPVEEPSAQSMSQVQGESLTTANEKPYLQSEACRYHKFKFGDDHHGNKGRYSFKTGIKKMKENENTRHEIAASNSERNDRVTCSSLEDESLFKEIAASESFKELQSVSVSGVLAPRGDNSRSRDKEWCRSSSSNSKSFIRSQQAQTTPGSAGIKSRNYLDEEAAQSVSLAELDAPKPKNVVTLLRVELPADGGFAQNVYAKKGKSFKGNKGVEQVSAIQDVKSVGTLRSEQVTDDLEYDELDPGPVLTGVTVSDDEFVRS